MVYRRATVERYLWIELVINFVSEGQKLGAGKVQMREQNSEDRYQTFFPCM